MSFLTKLIAAPFRVLRFAAGLAVAAWILFLLAVFGFVMLHLSFVGIALLRG